MWRYDSLVYYSPLPNNTGRGINIHQLQRVQQTRRAIATRDDKHDKVFSWHPCVGHRSARTSGVKQQRFTTCIFTTVLAALSPATGGCHLIITEQKPTKTKNKTKNGASSRLKQMANVTQYRSRSTRNIGPSRADHGCICNLRKINNVL